MKLSIFLSITMLISCLMTEQTIAGTLQEQVSQEQEQANNKALFLQAERLRNEYRFEEAINIYKSISDSSVVVAKFIALCENGISLLNYAARPVVTGKTTIPALDFFLYTPGTGTRLWAKAPADFNKTNTPQSDSIFSSSALYTSSAFHTNPVLYTKNESTLYFSAQDSNGNWDIYSTHLVDSTMWSAPEPLNEFVNSTGNELYPHISRDGKELYFASDGHFGIGGFDLYVSRWDDTTGDWGLPQNLGFPYSSTGDDLLFISDENGLFSYLFSNRDGNSEDTISIYRLNYDHSSIRSPVSSIAEALSIAALEPADDNSRNDHKENPDDRIIATNPETQEYVSMIAEVRTMRRSIDSLSSVIARNREAYRSLNEESEKRSLENSISEQEFELIIKQSALSAVNTDLQKKEMEFLTKGTIIPRDFAQLTAPKEEVKTENPVFKPEKAGWSTLPEMTFLDPVKKVNYTFRIEDESELIEEREDDMPNDLIYRVQLFSARQKADISALKGISPVFETETATGRWLYSAGQFYTETDAAAALSQTKRAGFPNAILTAYNNGKNITIAAARNLEKERAAKVTFQIVLENFPDGLPQQIFDILRENTEKDIAKSIVDGKDVYMVGPFSDKAEADNIASLLTESGINGVSVREIKSDRTLL